MVMFRYHRTEERLTLRGDDVRWLSNGIGGGFVRADAAHNLTVPEGFDRADLERYTEERLGDCSVGPTLLTGVRQTDARGARYGSVEAIATAGVSNPAVLPVGAGSSSAVRNDHTNDIDSDGGFEPGTVNVFVGTARTLSESGLTGLFATAVEAKTATLVETVGCTGTTSDALVVGCGPGGEPESFAGSATELGNAVRVCVRDAISAALDARYEGDPPTPETATHGVLTAGSATVFRP
jgi:adenosylcobinamide hydrolase